MKHGMLMKAVGLAAAAAFSLGAHAQSASATAASATASSQAAPSAAPASKAAKAANRALAKKIHRALAKTRGLDPTHIYVKVRDGAVTLTGSCTSQNQIDLAGKTVQDVSGVNSVNNRLSVKTPS